MADISITKEVDALLDHEVIAQPIDVVQWDSGVTIIIDVQNFTMPTGTTATCYTRKPSGLGVYQEDLTVDTSQNKVTIPVSNQALAEYGLALLQVKLHLGETVLSTFLIPLNVVISLQDDSADSCRHVVPPFDQAVADAIERIQNLTENITINTETGEITIPTALPNPRKLKFTGAVTGQYDGSSEVTINIPRTTVPASLKNPYPLNFTGGSTVQYDGSQAQTVEIPTTLKNPKALTFTGAVTDTYDGSAAKTINIPTTGACDGTLTFTGAVSASYNGSGNVTVNIPQGSSGENTGGTIDMRRVRFIDSRQGVDRNNMNQDLTDIINGLVEELNGLGGGTIVFGGGTYKARYINLKSKVSLIGVGRSITILTKIAGSVEHDAFIYIPPTSCLNQIIGMTITGPAAQDPDYTDNGTPSFLLSSDTARVHGIKVDDVGTDNAPDPWIEFSNEGTEGGSMSPTAPRTYKNVLIHDVICSRFGLSGFYVGNNCFSVYIDNSIAYANRKHGFEIYGSDCYYTLLHAEKNGKCGIWAVCGNCKFQSMKLIWNGFIEPDAIWSASENSNYTGLGKNWGLYARTGRSNFCMIEVQDNYAGGIMIDSTQSQFAGMLIDAGGYRRLGAGQGAQLYDALAIANSNQIIFSGQIANYKESSSTPHYLNAVNIKWLTKSIVDLIINRTIATNASALENDGNVITENLIRCQLRR